MNVPSELRYTASHEWVRSQADGTVLVGITDFAQEALGDVVFVELPAVGKAFAAGQPIAVVESVKAASDIYAPVAGSVTAVNEALKDGPEAINQDAFGSWLFRLQPSNAADVGALLDAAAYAAQAEAQK
jgi:glycine cleavage system H protein